MNGTWSIADIAGKPADVYDPPGERPRFGVLFLHPHARDTLRDNTAYSALLDEHSLACVCPHGARSWWADRVCAEFDPAITPERFLLDSVVPFFDRRWGLKPRALGLLGISMGGQGALRLGFKHPRLFPVVTAVSPAVEYHEYYGMGLPLDEMYDSKEQCRQDTAPMHVHPGDFPPHLFFCIDPGDANWARGAQRLHEKLNALGVPHKIDLATRAGEHTWEYFNHMADPTVRFLANGLERESLRLL
jgi:pimeloyl-ACP methyl ester carboxylesterase